MVCFLTIGERALVGVEEFAGEVPCADGVVPSNFAVFIEFKLIDVVANTIMTVRRQMSIAIVCCGLDFRRLATLRK